MADANIIADLLPLQWGGLDAPPYDLLTFEFENELAERRVPYLDGNIHDNTGRKSFPMTARLYFCNTVEGGPGGVRLFPDYWNEWAARLDGQARDLQHPILGPMRARVKGAKGEVRASVRSGIIVDVTWVETIEDPATATVLLDTQVDTRTLALAAGKAARQVGVSYPPPPGSPRNAVPTDEDLFNDVSAALGAAFGATLGAVARVNQILGRVGQMIDTVQALNDPMAWPALELLTQTWASLSDTAKRLVKAVRATASVTLTAPTTLDAFAVLHGNSLTDAMGLNLQALRFPLVARGSTLTYYT